jgi:hypothetical protein
MKIISELIKIIIKVNIHIFQKIEKKIKKIQKINQLKMGIIRDLYNFLLINMKGQKE